jgi:hypothetical protein
LEPTLKLFARLGACASSAQQTAAQVDIQNGVIRIIWLRTIPGRPPLQAACGAPFAGDSYAPKVKEFFKTEAVIAYRTRFANTLGTDHEREDGGLPCVRYATLELYLIEDIF